MLLGNQKDRSLLRNKIAYDLGVKTGLTNIPNSEFVDLYVNGEYIGNYLLSDKVETGDSRIALSDEKGVLIEIDNAYAYEEPYYFINTMLNTTYVLKESYAGDNDLGDEAEAEALNSFKRNLEQFARAINSENTTWEEITSLIDVESFAKLYLLMELAEDWDGFYSSTFFYKDGDNDVIHAGPLWDFDAAMGYLKSDTKGGNPNIDYILKYKTTIWWDELFEYNEFIVLVNKIYNEQMKDEFHQIPEHIDNYVQNIQKSVQMNFVRWDYLLGNTFETPYTTPNGNTYEEEVDYLKQWLIKRVEYMDNRYSEKIDASYKVYVQDIEWTPIKAGGQIAGTEGKSLRVEGIKINLPIDDENVHIKYKVHAQDIGWMDWVKDGKLAGTTGQSKRIEAIRIELEGLEDYDVKYRVHVQDIGWMDWTYNGNIAGTVGQSKRIEAIEIKINEKEETINPYVKYNAHIQNYGWEKEFSKTDEKTSGTTGEGLRLEAIKIKIENIPEDVSIKYKVHVQDIGWMNWVKDGDLAGTTGEGKRLEAIQIELEGLEEYNIEYRVHVQDIGWMNWVKNGEKAGTEGQSKRIEAIQIKITNK